MSDPASVIIPTHDRAPLILRAIRSALDVMRQSDELIVVDDHSTDDTWEVLSRFVEARERPDGAFIPIRRISLPDNRGPGAARNVGIEHATHPLLAFLDSDDVWLPDSLEMRRQVMDARPELVCAFGDFRIRRRDGTIQHDALHAVHRRHPRVGSKDAPSLREALPSPGDYFSVVGAWPPGWRDSFPIHVGDMRALEMHAHWIVSDTALVRRSLAPNWRFPEDARLMEDYEAFARLSKLGPCAYLDVELAEVGEDADHRLTAVDELAHQDARIRTIERSGLNPDIAAWMGALSSRRSLRDRIARGQKVRDLARSFFSWARERVG